MTFLRPDDPAYAEELATDNHSVTHHPEVVVAATGPEDVAEAVRYAAGRGLSVGVQATGHGMAAAADGVLVTTGRLDHVEVDPDRRVLRVGAGARWRDVLPAVAPYDLAPLNGSSPNVGVAGYVLGGGVGMLGRQHGYAADHVRRVRLVTADGAVREVGAESEPELFWAVRGAKGALGIATELELDLFPVRALVGGGLFFADGAAADVLAAYVAWAPTLPREVATSLLLAPGLVHLRFAAFDGADVGVLDTMRAAGPVERDTVGPLAYADIGTIHDEPVGQAYEVHESGVFTDVLTDPSPLLGFPGLVEVRHHGAAYAEAPAVPNAVGGRDAEFTVYTSSLPDDAAAHRELRSALADHDRGTVLNFLGAGASPDDVRTAFRPEAWDRLVAAKRAWDPEDLFRVGLPWQSRRE